MVFHSHSYLPRATFKEKLTQFVESFGQEPLKFDSGDLLPPDTFLEMLHTSTIPDNNAYGSPVHSLAVAVGSTDLQGSVRHHRPYAFRFILELGRVYLQEPRDDDRGEPTEVWNLLPFIGTHGYNQAPDGQADIAKSNYVSISLEGQSLLDYHAAEYGHDASELRTQQRNVLIKMLDLLAADYGFFTNESDYEL